MTTSTRTRLIIMTLSLLSLVPATFVEDNAEAEKPATDRYTFGFYRSTLPTWVPSDAELKFDSGAGMMWIATDAERDDDKGISSQPREQGQCDGFPLALYELEELPKDGGDIQVKP